MRLTPNEMAHVLLNTRWREAPAEHKTAIMVGLAESKGDTDAQGVNDRTRPVPVPLPRTWGSVDLGWLQVNNWWHREKLARGNWRNPYFNAEVGYLVWKENGGPKKDEQDTKWGWMAWATYNNGSYLQFEKHAETGLLMPMAPIAWP